MKRSMAGKRQTGNKTVQTPRAPVNHEAAKGGVSKAGMAKGYDVAGKMPVLSSPKAFPNKKSQ